MSDPLPYQTLEVDLTVAETPDAALNGMAAQGYAVVTTMPAEDGRVRFLMEHRSVRPYSSPIQPARPAPTR